MVVLEQRDRMALMCPKLHCNPSIFLALFLLFVCFFIECTKIKTIKCYNANKTPSDIAFFGSVFIVCFSIECTKIKTIKCYDAIKTLSDIPLFWVLFLLFVFFR